MKQENNNKKKNDKLRNEIHDFLLLRHSLKSMMKDNPHRKPPNYWNYIFEGSSYFDTDFHTVYSNWNFNVAFASQKNKTLKKMVLPWGLSHKTPPPSPIL